MNAKGAIFNTIQQHKWFYPLFFTPFFMISMIPLYTERPYPLQNTQDVIVNLLMVAGVTYAAYAPIFYIVTLLGAALIFHQSGKLGRLRLDI